MNKRQRKKALKKWLAHAVYIEDETYTYDVGRGPWLEDVFQLERDIARAFAVPPHILYGDRYERPQLLLGWDGPITWGPSPLADVLPILMLWAPPGRRR